VPFQKFFTVLGAKLDETWTKWAINAGLAHGAVLTVFSLKKSAFKFGHQAMHVLPEGPLLANSYHCSRYNTNTGRLTKAMFENVFSEIRDHLERS
jgi:uracil-DNA glycosylase